MNTSLPQIKFKGKGQMVPPEGYRWDEVKKEWVKDQQKPKATASGNAASAQ